MFDDYEPEDAWHPDDPVPEQMTNIRRRLALLIESEDWWDYDQELMMLNAVLSLARLGRLSPRNVIRADDLETDMRFVSERLEP